LNKIILLTILIFICSCKKSTQEFNNLTDAERTYLRDQSRQKCLNQYSKAHDNFIEDSNGAFSSTSFKRHQGWTYKYLEGTTALRTITVKVWKQVLGSDLYLYITDTGGGETDNYFLKLNATQNRDMIDDLYNDQCALNPKIYDSFSMPTSGPLVINYLYNETETSNTLEYTDNYTFDFKFPAYFNRFNLKRTIITKVTDTGATSSTANYTSSAVEEDSEFTTTDYTALAARYCEIGIQSGVGVYRPVKKKFGFYIDVDNCPTTSSPLPSGWDLTIGP
jgi:hypothetical protein